jgi:hypothetical protein
VYWKMCPTSGKKRKEERERQGKYEGKGEER